MERAKTSKKNPGHRIAPSLLLSPRRVGQSRRREQLEPDGRRRVVQESFEHGGLRERLEGKSFAPVERFVCGRSGTARASTSLSDVEATKRH